MASYSFEHVAIRALATAVPDHVKVFDQSTPKVQRFVKQIGIEQVHISVTEQTPVDLGYVALNEALAQSGWDASCLDLVVFDTQTPDYMGGVGDGSFLHHYLDLREDCAVFDLSVGCAAFPYALSVACAQLSVASSIKRVAVVMGDSQWIYFANAEAIAQKKTMLVGEGVGVILLERVASEVPPIKIELYAQGHGYKSLSFHHGIKNAWRRAAAYEMPDGGEMYLQGASCGTYMDGSDISDFAKVKICAEIKAHCAPTFASDFDYYVFHQANQSILDEIAANLGLDSSKVPSSLKHFGNTYCASAILTMCDQLCGKQGPLHIFNASYGVGLAWGFTDLVVPAEVICPIVATAHRFDEHFLKPLED